jgi:hypothetical protein
MLKKSYISRPPATRITWPVIQLASGDTRNATVDAISFGSPRRLIGIVGIRSSSVSLSIYPVCVAPGATVLIVI